MYFRRSDAKIFATRIAVLLALSFLEQPARGKLGYRGKKSPNAYDIALHNRNMVLKYGETVRSGRSSRVWRLRSLGLFLMRKECCGQVLCGYCYDYHVIHSCPKGSQPTEVRPVTIAFRPVPTAMLCSHLFHRVACARTKSAAFVAAFRWKIPRKNCPKGSRDKLVVRAVGRLPV
jgi:hypothetical protein